MINKIQLLRNIGKYDSVSLDGNTHFSRLTLIYAENGRGKTTLASILRSLATGNPIHITERRRLAAQNPPHVIIDCEGASAPAIFTNDEWTRILPNMVVFDDSFIDQNISSGLVVGTGHRQNLHELILGVQGVSLNQRLQDYVGQIEQHNAALRTKAAAIPPAELGSFSVSDFCVLPNIDDIDVKITKAERDLEAAKEKEHIRNTPVFEFLNLPSFDIKSIELISQQDLENLETVAVAHVQKHLERIGHDAEAWIENGMSCFMQEENDDVERTCPFCAQELTYSPIIDNYQIYFNEAYKKLKESVGSTLATLNRTHGREVPADFERALRVAGERNHFWSQFCDVPLFNLDTEVIVSDWNKARETLFEKLRAKQAAPLEKLSLSDGEYSVLNEYEGHRQRLVVLNQQIQQANNAIMGVKEQAESVNTTTISNHIALLKATKARHMPSTSLLCTEYLSEVEAKESTERFRDQVKVELDQYRTTIFPEYKTAINTYLSRFNAGYQLHSLDAQNTRGGPTCTYSVLINNTPIPISGSNQSGDIPSFRNTLSAGDRNTLALAFFFASLDQDPEIANKIVVIDDPVSSMDEHRSLTTVQELRRLSRCVSQVIVLSHSKPFLCSIWEGADRTERTAFKITRQGTGSTICSWDINQDSITEHDRRHTLLRDYLNTGNADTREVASSIRPLLEMFFRVAYPEHFPPETLLGPFRNSCNDKLGSSQEILNVEDTHELQNLIEYANQFHHDTNAVWRTVEINEGQLTDFVTRTLNFCKR